VTETKIEEKQFQWKTKPNFKAGDAVRIVDSEKSTKSIYAVMKVKKLYDGTIFYLLETESSPVKILFYETDKSHLEKA